MMLNLNLNRTMEIETITKNEASLKSQMSRRVNLSDKTRRDIKVSRKILTSLFICLAMVINAQTVRFSAVNSDGVTLYYASTDGKSAILVSSTTYKNIEGRLIIPNEVMYDGVTYSVTEIGRQVFQYCNKLRDVTIGDNVTTIGRAAFAWCSNSGMGITNVTFGNSLRIIEESAFSFTTTLQGSLILPNSLETIGDRAFTDGGGEITSITIGDNYSGDIFLSFGNLRPTKEWIISENNKEYSSSNGVLFDKSKQTLLEYPLEKPDELYVIPNTVTVIGDGAFESAKNLKGVTIPYGVVKLTGFSGCSGLTEITIPESVVTLGGFSYCSGLTEVVIPNSVNTIIGGGFSELFRFN